MDFTTGLSISTDWKGESYDSILIIVDWFIKMLHYEPAKITIDTSGLVKVILNVVIWHYGLSNSIVSDKSLFFASKFWLSLCYYLEIKQRLFITFFSQIDKQMEQ